jgi:hypothetical protein
MRKTHGEKTNTSRLYGIWSNMIQRCYNSKCPTYKWYGARGITVCNEWRDYLIFKDWAFSNGYSDELSIDRINVNGNYEPNNCKWSDVIEQCNNRRSNRVLTYNGESYTISQWAKKLGVPSARIQYRLYNGWSIEDALTKQPMKNQYS